MFVCLSNKAINARSPISVSEGRETPLALHGESYPEIWSRIQSASDADNILLPTTQHVERVISRVTSDDFTRLAHSYFRNTNTAAEQCLFLRNILNQTRDAYEPLHESLKVLPIHENDDGSSLTQSQCDTAYYALERFNSLEIPFLNQDIQSFQDEFSILIEQLSVGLHELGARPRTPLRRASSGIVSAVRRPFSCLRVDADMSEPNPRRKRADVAMKVFFVVNKRMDGLRREADFVKVKVERDKTWVQIGVDMDRDDRRTLVCILKELLKNHSMLIAELTELEEDLCSCLRCIIQARRSLFDVLPIDEYTLSPSLSAPC